MHSFAQAARHKRVFRAKQTHSGKFQFGSFVQNRRNRRSTTCTILHIRTVHPPAGRNRQEPPQLVNNTRQMALLAHLSAHPAAADTHDNAN